ncbi:DDHD family phospholipase [Aspergillus novofumigatus IBT 16806]|uniref:DDHD domain protein n=1 Tax=Aspergillus novofumigatus (strain IBT 16806) TaxID=1392255 RepID=A0A2I1CLT3_ASPN1|nr:DDHD domain protein [Aspergillus novofumigatus IBT 16806]PKX98574.1 DDHD domain protein [Aspergillus novofumigatus IBT 16806]
MSRESQRGSFLGAISSWNASRNTKTPPNTDGSDVLPRSQGEDHTITHRHRLSLRHYPPDCPPLRVRWFYAVDSPKRKPLLSEHQKEEPKPLPAPKKFVPFSSKDSQAIESTFQKLSDVEIAQEQTRKSESLRETRKGLFTVPVNEDNLFDVDIERRELTPAYWIGPTYEVRRGTWFFQEGFKPCEENLATQLEEGYLKLKPWRLENDQSKLSQTVANPTSQHADRSDVNKSGLQCTPEPELCASRPLTGQAGHATSVRVNEPRHYRLFGAYMNYIVTYQDHSTALLANDDFMSRMSSTVYQKLGGIPGTRVVRGFIETKRQKETSAVKSRDHSVGTKSSSDTPSAASTDHEVKSDSEISSDTRPNEDVRKKVTNQDDPRSTLERQMSSLAGEPQNTAELEEQARKQEEKEMEVSREADEEDRERQIDHLILVTHGIGQRLGLRLESINFIHDVNVLRKTMKSVYKASPDLQALNSSFSDSQKNCRVQVLPVCWRHLLDFPYRGVRQNRKELDLADADFHDDSSYPGLNDITLDSVPAVRNLISDLAMDVLLYQSAYCEHISTIVKQECNRILKLFKQRNPTFKGSVSLCGHSLGSAILFDILCHQPSTPPTSGERRMDRDGSQDILLDFDCEELFCLGSPIALFQMIKGNTIAGRSVIDGANTKRSKEECDHRNPTSSSSASRGASVHASTASGEGPTIVSSPKCRQLYNIFHPSDPVSYRIEPLISPAMSSLKPQPLPSVKKSLWAAPGQSLSMIGSRVGQSVGTLWTNFATGVASSLLNRSLGLGSEETSQSTVIATETQMSRGSLANSSLGEDGSSRSGSGLDSQEESADRYRTLIDWNLETLYEGTNRTKTSHHNDILHSAATESAVGLESEDLRRLKMEDAKMRALNTNGRVDYSIQEGAFDISLIASIASHLTYWADEDVNHFMLSQMLSRNGRHRSVKD